MLATGQCEPVDLCAIVTCPAGQACDTATGQCSPSCSAPSGAGGLRIANTRIGTTNIAFDASYWVQFDKPVAANTFSPSVVTVIDAGIDNSLDTSDDMILSPAVSLSPDNMRISVNLTPTGALNGGRKYRVTIEPGCLMSQPAPDPLGVAIPGVRLDGEYNGLLPSGDGQQGGSFVQEFVGIAQRVYARNTSGISALAIRPTDGELYGVGASGAVGPIPFDANVGNELTPMAALPTADSTDLGLGFAPDGNTILVTRWNNNTGMAFLQRISLETAQVENETIVQPGTGFSYFPDHMRIVPAGYSGIVSPGEIVCATITAGQVGIFVLDISTSPAQVRTFYLDGGPLPFSFDAAGSLTVFDPYTSNGDPYGNYHFSIKSVFPSGMAVELVNLGRFPGGYPFSCYPVGFVGSFRLPADFMVTASNCGISVVPIGTAGKFDQSSHLPSEASDVVLSNDRTRLYVALPDDDIILEFSGFPVQ